MRPLRRLFLWWLQRPARTPKWVRLMLALALSSVALVSFASAASSPSGGSPNSLPNAPDKSPEPPGPGASTTSFSSSAALVTEGQALYENGCSSCHAALLQGQAGVAPSLVGVGAGPVDFYLSTGRMPLQNPRDEPERAPALYNRRQINALIAFITKTGGGPAAPAANPAAGSLVQGLHQFTLNCAGCHQIVGRGGLTLGAYVPDLQQATPLQIAEAVRMGPYLMPHFDAQQIDQQQLNSIARYVLWTRHPDDAGGWGIGNIGPIPEGMVAWFIALAAMVIVARLIGERTA
jgi:ubiquinol-cytochrome c reductase cytochrome c subunit